MREVDATLLHRSSKVVVDTREGALQEAGDLLIPMNAGEWDAEQLYGELAEIVSEKKPGRERPEEITVFKSVGVAFLDTMVAKSVYERRDGSTGEPSSTSSGETAPARGRQKKRETAPSGPLTLDRERAIFAPAPRGVEPRGEKPLPDSRQQSREEPSFRPKTVNGQDRHVRWKNRPKAGMNGVCRPVPGDLRLARSILPLYRAGRCSGSSAATRCRWLPRRFRCG